MQIELRKKIIKTLIEQPQSSTKLLLSHQEDFEDRRALSLFLNNMKRDLLIERQPNSYWRSTDKGVDYYHFCEGGAPAATDLSQHVHTAEPEQDETGPVETDNKGPAPIRGTSPDPVPDKKTDLIGQLRDMIPDDNVSLVIEQGGAWGVVGGSRFNLVGPADLDAFLRMAQNYIGEVQ